MSIRQENSIRAHLLHPRGTTVPGYRDIRARTDTQGSTLMARATGGSSKVTYPRKPRVSFPFTRAGSPPLAARSRATYIYLHTFLSMTESRPPPTTRELELLDPAWVRAADKPPLSIGIAQRAVRHGRYSCECKCTRVYLMWVALSPCSSRLVNFCSLTGHHARCAAGLSIAIARGTPPDNDARLLQPALDSACRRKRSKRSTSSS